MDAIIREIKAAELGVLKEFLYHAIYVPEGKRPYPKEIIYIPEAYIFVRDFGMHGHDFCLVAESGGDIVGTVWSRMEKTEVKAIGKPDSNIPEIAVAVLPELRGKGVGSRLILEMLRRLKENGYAGVTLSVCKTNAAYKLYERLGFVISAENKDDFFMDFNF